ncbi:MAG: S41 family peptidase, partial [Thermoguttaceae bacterium]
MCGLLAACLLVPGSQPQVFAADAVKSAPTNKKAAHGNLIVEGVGWKNVKIGANREDIIKTLGEPDNDRSSDFLSWSEKHLDCCFGHGSATEIHFNPGFQDALANGIRLGSPESTIVGLYGQPDYVTSQSSDVKRYTYAKKGIFLWSGQGKITQIVVIKAEGTEWQVIERIGKGFVAAEWPMPQKMPELKIELSEAERLENFEILWQAFDKYYSFFDLKKIDWQAVKRRYEPRVRVAAGKDYYRMLYEFIHELKDYHVYTVNYRLKRPMFCPNVSIRRIEGKAVVTDITKGSEAYVKGLRLGAVISLVDGLSVAEKVEQLRPLLKVCSSERTFQEMAYWYLLDGKKGSKVQVTFFPPDDDHAVVSELRRGARMPRGKPWQYRAMSFPVEKQKFIWSGILPSGYGYIRIVSFSGREEIADQFDRALEKLKDTQGLIIDVRDNPGGSGVSQPHIIGRLITAEIKAETGFRKNGPGHQDFRRNEFSISPAGAWQYTKPVALLTNVITGSASDLFTCRMRAISRLITVGTTTQGDLTGTSVYVVLPCGLVVRIPDGYITDIEGRVIEVNGNVPRIHADLTIKDVVNETDSVLARAVKALRE